MRPSLFAAVAFAVTSLAAPAQDKSDPSFCDRGRQLLQIAQSWEDCSELYIQTMKACVLAVCAVYSGLADMYVQLHAHWMLRMVR